MDTELDINAIPAHIATLKLDPGDVLVVRVGLTAEQMGGDIAWIPTHDELRLIADDVALVAPEGVKTFITHLGVNYEVVRGLEGASDISVQAISEDDFARL